MQASPGRNRTQAQISYRYERRFDYDDDVGDNDVHTGPGTRIAFGLTATALTLEAGALATRARSDIRGAAPGNLVGNVDNISQVYAVYAGPSISKSVGPVQLAAGLGVGYTKVEVPNATGLAPGQRRLDYYDDSAGVNITASAGTAARTVLPVGVTISGAYELERAGQLDQKYEGYYGRGDVVLPVSRTLAVRGGVGYENIESSQRDALVDGNGDAVLDRHGRFVTDPNSPRRIAYNTDGLIYDAGVIWRPTPRLELQANAGWRYGGETYYGTLSWQMQHNTGLQVLVYDGIETFGRQLRDGLRNSPTSFQTRPDPFGQQFGGCIFAAKPGNGGGAGGCLNDAFQSISTASYRARGIDAVISTVRGPTSMGFGAGYSNRKLYAPDAAPGITVFGTDDESYYAQLFWSRALSAVSRVDLSLFENYYESGLPGADGVFSASGQASYNHQFGRLSALAAIGVYTFDQERFESQWSAQALLGARYTF